MAIFLGDAATYLASVREEDAELLGPLRSTEASLSDAVGRLGSLDPAPGYEATHERLRAALGFYREAAQALLSERDGKTEKLRKFRELMQEAGKNFHGALAELPLRPP